MRRIAPRSRLPATTCWCPHRQTISQRRAQSTDDGWMETIHWPPSLKACPHGPTASSTPVALPRAARQSRSTIEMATSTYLPTLAVAGRVAHTLHDEPVVLLRQPAFARLENKLQVVEPEETQAIQLDGHPLDAHTRHRRPRCRCPEHGKGGLSISATVDCMYSKEHPSPPPVSSTAEGDPMTIDNPHRPTSSGIVYVLALVALVAVIVIAATSLWQADNSGTNALSGDPQATTPQSPQTAP